MNKKEFNLMHKKLTNAITKAIPKLKLNLLELKKISTNKVLSKELKQLIKKEIKITEKKIKEYLDLLNNELK
jgi:hypothetical protein